MDDNPHIGSRFDDFLREEGIPRGPIPPTAMRVGPGTDAVVWNVCPGEGVEL